MDSIYTKHKMRRTVKKLNMGNAVIPKSRISSLYGNISFLENDVIDFF